MKALQYIILTFITISLPSLLSAQIENVIVEKYYIADSNDASDTTGGRSVEEGSVTYRVFIDLAEGSKLKRIYGSQSHPLKIVSTENFYNNNDRPTANFGYLLNHLWLKSNPTLALDSWITLGRATKNHEGVPKVNDPDSSFITGDGNNGGTAGIPEGLLLNDNPEMGIPLHGSDGLAPKNGTLGQWVSVGFDDAGSDTTIFGPYNTGSSFIGKNIYLQQNDGVVGADSIENIVLVAQLTTKGDLKFELNVEVEIQDGALTKIIKYVANDSVSLLADERVSPFLSYPPSCGCLDPDYLEFSENYACSEPDSCQTLIVFGCTDTLACNYDPEANFNIHTLCCYVGLCNDRDITVVCPDEFNGRNGFFNFSIYPNPVKDFLSYKFTADGQPSSYKVYDAVGKVVREAEIGYVSSTHIDRVDVSDLETGFYMFELVVGNQNIFEKFIKN